MEMPDCCWRCGRLGHHRQACNQNISKFEEYSISRLCKRIQKNFENQKKPIVFKIKPELQCFPITLLEAQLNRSTSFYYEKLCEAEEIGRPSFLSLEEIRRQNQLHHNVNLEILKQREIDDQLLSYCRNRLLGDFVSEDEKENFGFKIEDYQYFRINSFDTSNRLTIWSYNAIGSASIFWAMEKKIENSPAAISGRPTLNELETLKRVYENNKQKLFTMQREARNLRNICREEEVLDLMKILFKFKTRLNSLLTRLYKAETSFKESELDMEKKEVKAKLELLHGEQLIELKKKVACILCEENEKQWALPCGHIYCTDCMQNLERTRTTAGVPWEDEFGQEHPTHDVIVMKQCAFCKGTLKGKFRIYL